MTKFKTSVDFIHLCREYEGEERLQKLCENLNLNIDVLKANEQALNKVCDFIRYLDLEAHKYNPSSKRGHFIDDTLHSHISSDTRAILLLSLQGHSYQSNIILRHLIESFTITLWGDICSRFRDTLDYLLENEKWKPYRAVQRITWEPDQKNPRRSIKERLEKIRLLNMIDYEGKEFYNYYLSNASGCDLIILFSLPICKECALKEKDRVNYNEFHLDPKIRKEGKEDKHAVFKSDFGLECGFCRRQRLSEGFAMGIPEANDMFDMLCNMLDGLIVNRLRDLQNLYKHLSEEYVHFSTTVHPDEIAPDHDLGYGKRSIWGLNGLDYLIDILKPVMEFYFDEYNKAMNQKKS